MVKRLHLQDIRKNRRRDRRPPPEHWVFEPLDVGLVAIFGAIMVWLQSLP